MIRLMRTPGLLIFMVLIAGSSCGRDRSPADVHVPEPTQNANTERQTTRQELGDGLVVTDMLVGHGAACNRDSIVEVHYVAKLADGTLWDSTDRRKRSMTFDLQDPGLIEGLRRGIVGMRIGGKRRIEIPWALGYGATGRDPVPPKTDLIFEIEIIDVQDTGAAVK